jgi:hypothetical protein
MCHFTKVGILFVNTYLNKTKIRTVEYIQKKQYRERLHRNKTGKKGLYYISRLRGCNSWDQLLGDSIQYSRCSCFEIIFTNKTSFL